MSYSCIPLYKGVLWSYDIKFVVCDVWAIIKVQDLLPPIHIYNAQDSRIRIWQCLPSGLKPWKKNYLVWLERLEIQLLVIWLLLMLLESCSIDINDIIDYTRKQANSKVLWWNFTIYALLLGYIYESRTLFSMIMYIINSKTKVKKIKSKIVKLGRNLLTCIQN